MSGNTPGGVGELMDDVAIGVSLNLGDLAPGESSATPSWSISWAVPPPGPPLPPLDTASSPIPPASPDIPDMPASPPPNHPLLPPSSPTPGGPGSVSEFRDSLVTAAADAMGIPASSLTITSMDPTASGTTLVVRIEVTVPSSESGSGSEMSSSASEKLEVSDLGLGVRRRCCCCSQTLSSSLQSLQFVVLLQL